MKILLTIATLGAGGAERVMTLLAEEFASRGHQVTLMTLDAPSNDFFTVGPGVQRVTVGLYGPSMSWIARLTGNLQRIRQIRSVVLSVRPDAVVSFITEMNVLTIIACARLRIPVLVSERTDPRVHRVGHTWTWLRQITYRHCAGLVVPTQAVASWVSPSAAGAPPVTVIPNPVLRPGTPGSRAVPGARPYLFAAGRLIHLKGFDLLIRALALLMRCGADFDLVIAGAGVEEAGLRRLASELGVSARLRLIGRVESLESWMAAAFAFVLSSRYEGFPNVLLEALASGTPVIATDCPSGPREILEGGNCGILVPCDDPEAIATAVTTLQANPGLQARLRTLGPRVIERFGVPAVAAQWESLMQRVILR
ncbi:MAG TPA: glycosyltransferase [Steroidobacteraceae bacterium]|jgi:glycosyltransferase involved in cell wall biosynthesis